MWALICALVSHLFCVRWVYRVHFRPNKFFWGLKGKFYLRVLFYTTVFVSMSDIHVLIHVCHYRHIGHKLELVSGFCKLIPFRSQIPWPSDQVSNMQIEYFSEVIESKVIFLQIDTFQRSSTLTGFSSNQCLSEVRDDVLGAAAQGLRGGSGQSQVKKNLTSYAKKHWNSVKLQWS